MDSEWNWRQRQIRKLMPHIAQLLKMYFCCGGGSLSNVRLFIFIFMEQLGTVPTKRALPQAAEINVLV